MGAHREFDNALEKPGHWHLHRSLFKELLSSLLVISQDYWLFFYTFAKQNTDYFKKEQIKFPLLTISGLS